MVMDAKITVTVKPPGDDATVEDELLCPERHGITFPVNGLNVLFENECETVINHHFKLDANRYEPFFFINQSIFNPNIWF